jgi:ATP-dependent RNA helicase RhlE
LKGVRAAGLTEPTAIQSKSIPVILQGNDLIGAAQSGSGKTGAYALPILARLLDSTSRLRAIVLVPTRELASYVETRFRDYARYTDVRIGVVFTGAPLQQQERVMREQEPDVLVATPGRLIELHGRGCLNFENVEMLVLDEADRMVSLGLAPDLRRLLKLLPETRQTLLFSMTMPPELNRLAKDALIEPVRVDLAPAARPSAGILQAIYPVPKELKPDLLHEMLARAEVRNSVIFTRARYGADRLAKVLLRRGYAVNVLDDHPSQSEREMGLEDLRRGRVQILVASDASSRSLDLAGVSHVVNFDVPQTPEDYVHRLGRGGRAEPVGDAFTLMSPEEQKDVAAIERFLGRAIPRVLLPDFDYNMRPTELRPLPSYVEEPARLPDKRRASGVQAAAARIAGQSHVKTAAAPPAPKTHGGSTISRASNGTGRFVSAGARATAKPDARPPVRAAKKPSAPARTASAQSRAPARPAAKRKSTARPGTAKRK